MNQGTRIRVFRMGKVDGNSEGNHEFTDDPKDGWRG